MPKDEWARSKAKEIADKASQRPEILVEPPKPKLMPFGKYKGKPIASLPPAYVEWFLENVKGFDQLKDEMIGLR